MVAVHPRCGIPLTQQVPPPTNLEAVPSYPEAIPPYLAAWSQCPCLERLFSLLV